VTLLECGRRVGGPWRAWVGYRGLSAHHLEGDGTTPLGTYSIGSTLYGLDASPGVRLRYHRLTCGDWWNEDPRSSTYNSFRHVRCGSAPPFGAGSEALWRAPVAYRELAVIEYNVQPAIPGRGSAIFIHDDLGHATHGCVSLPRPELLRTLRWLRPGATISIGTRSG
jgi:L,D-peptidoglycan transpeptidase YkuD (ErfK/YbiS/YcfS/YnhG family)